MGDVSVLFTIEYYEPRAQISSTTYFIKGLRRLNGSIEVLQIYSISKVTHNRETSNFEFLRNVPGTKNPYNDCAG